MAVCSEMQIKWVRQEDKSGCVLACLAMITGRSYQDVKAEFAKRDWESEEGGVPAVTAAPPYLAEYGFACVIKHSDGYPFAEKRNGWPTEPFAEVHICTVMTERSHAVLMLHDGSVLDPSSPKPKLLSDYSRVEMIAGVFPTNGGVQ